MKKHLPNLITLGNLVFGCCAIICVLSGQYQLAVYCLFGSFACDYADGMIARALNVHSPLGKQLDSLADVISFGAVPGMFIYTLLSRHFCAENGLPDNVVFSPLCGKSAIAFIFSACAALRLGKFNLDTRQTTYFLGLSTPAATIFVTGLAMAILTGQPLAKYFDQPWLILLIGLVLCVLMLSEVKLLGLKLNPKDLKANWLPLLMVIVCAALVFFIGYLGAAAAVLIYIFGSLLYFGNNANQA